MQKRLQAIAGCVPVCTTVADIGCDHGYVGASLLKQGVAKEVLFADVSAPSLQKAKDLCRKRGLEEYARFFVTDGFDGLPPADVAVIAGMGGRETLAILQKAEQFPQTLVLQPMQDVALLAGSLAPLGYEIEKDFILRDGKFYRILVAERVPVPRIPTEEEIRFGRTNLSSPTEDFIAYLQHTREKWLSRLQKTAVPEVQVRLCETERLLKALAVRKESGNRPKEEKTV